MTCVPVIGRVRGDELVLDPEELHGIGSLIDALVADEEPEYLDGHCRYCGADCGARICDGCGDQLHEEDYPFEEGE